MQPTSQGFVGGSPPSTTYRLSKVMDGFGIGGAPGRERVQLVYKSHITHWG